MEQARRNTLVKKTITYLWTGCWLALACIAYGQSGETPEELYVKGLTAFGSGDYGTAIQHFSEIAGHFGDEPSMKQAMEKVFYALGCSYYNAGSFAQAIETFETYARRYPEARFRDEALFRIGNAHQAEEDYNKAITSYRRLLSERPSSEFSEDAFFQIGICYMASDENEEALKTFTAFRQNAPRSPLADQAGMFQARLLFEADDLEQAIAVIADLHRHANSLDSIAYINFLGMEIGDRAFENTDYELALSAYRHIRTRGSILRLQRKWIETVKSRLSVLDRRGGGGVEQASQTFRERRQLQQSLFQAETLLAKLEETPSYDASLWHRMGRCFFALDRYWEARVAFARVVDEETDETIREVSHFDLILVLQRMRRFNDLIARADGYLEQFRDHEDLIERGRVPTVAFIRAEAYINQERFEDAEPEMSNLLADYPDHKQKPRIEFYLALCATMQERFEEGVTKFDQWLKNHSSHLLKTEVEYWKPIAMFYGGMYDTALPLFDRYAEEYPMSVYTPEAAFRAALCQYSLEDFEDAAHRLAELLIQYPDHLFQWEARITRGDALAAVGQLEEAIESYEEVGNEAGPYYFLALTQMAKVCRAMDDEAVYQRMVAAFAQYIRSRPQSGNVVEAAYQAGWALRQMGQIEQARTLYWNVLTRHGNTRPWEGFDALLTDLARLYANEGADVFRADVTQALKEAVSRERKTLAARLMVAQVIEADAAEQQRVARTLAEKFNPGDLGPEALTFVGRVLAEDGATEQALLFFRHVLEDFGDSRYVPEAHMRLAEATLAGGDVSEAMLHVEQALDLAQDIQLYIETLFLKAQCQEAMKEYSAAIDTYKEVLANRTTPTALKPQALLGIGRCHEQRGEFRESIPFYQRVYVLYRAYTDAVATAYWQSGQAFERLKDRAAALRTYRELTEAEDLADRPEVEKARKRMAELET